MEGSLGHLGVAGVSGRPGGPAGRADRRGRRRGRRPGDRRAPGRRAAGQPAHRVVRDRAARGARPGRRRGARPMTVRVGVVVFPGSNCDTRHAARPRARRRRAGRPVARGGRPRRRRGGRPARRLRLRRLPAGGRHRPVQPGHAQRRRVRGGRRARARHLQRLPGPRRGGPRARRAPAQPRACASWAATSTSSRSGSTRRSPGRSPGRRPLRLPIAHGEGCYYADDATLDALEADGQVLFRYVQPDGEPAEPSDGEANPNGSLRAIAGRARAGRQRGRPDAPPGAGRGGRSSARTTAWRSCARSSRSAAERVAAGGTRRRGRPVTVEPMAPSRRRADDAPAESPAAPLHRALGITDEELDAIAGRLGRAAERPRARDVQRHVERALQLQELAAAPAHAADGAAQGSWPARARTPASSTSATGSAVAFKIESHNHPSAVEPYQGAATGRRRDPARHLHDGRPADRGPRRAALRRSGRPADAPPRRRGRPRASAATATASACRPSAASSCSTRRTAATRSSTSWPSACCRSSGSRWRARPARATSSSCSARRPGRDGIGGASVLASATFADDDPSKRPSVQVGDPFAEKLLIEASLELIEGGLVEGLQDLGAGGITCATSELADRGGTGMLVDLDAIPRREPGMAPFEVMISESQERMCAIVLPGAARRGRGRLRPLGPARRGHRPGDRRRRHRDRRRAASTAAGRPGAGRPRDRPHPRPGPHLRRDRPRPAGQRRRRAAARRRRPARRSAGPTPARACRSGAWTPAPSCSPSSAARTSPPAAG